MKNDTALGEFKDIRAVEPLILTLKHPDEHVRAKTVSVLGDLKDIRAVNPIMDLLNDPNDSVRNATAIAIKQFNVSSIQKDTGVIREKEIVREIVKVPCSYCGTLVDMTYSKCPSCGAPFKINR